MEGCEREEPQVKVGICWQLSDGRYLSGRDGNFIEQVLEDIQSFKDKSVPDSVLVFPPFKNFHRFLIHNLVDESFEGLTTFSIGQSVDRRTVVCHKRDLPSGDLAQRVAGHRAEDAAATGRKKARMLPDVAIYRPPALRGTTQGDTTNGLSPTERNPKQRQTRRRPDMAVYVPRALRGTMAGSTGAEQSEAGGGSSVVPCAEGQLAAGGSTVVQLGSGGGSSVLQPAGAGGGEGSNVEGAGVVLDEVVAAVGRVSVVERPRLDYGAWRSDGAVPLSELSHVVEVFGFPAEFKTHDLVSILSAYGGGGGFEIKWVDDTHALAVFSSAFVAADVLSLRHPMVKTCALEDASAASKAKARKLCESLKVPYRPRPETCPALAQRLITGALGVHHRQSKAEREQERRMLREARGYGMEEGGG
ncbi:R3H and coiled-coil domain-containing protein 1 isoform X2 [Ischnura elegans]|uniref:R3H and coiled-coil domain-containing protein 1 isoform X2 n=1 Tax=Ischnura elegans TaxID=197161 RepID=UPI001ED86881|nr:R3H and coiled-coil domain-containing protein 1 isoform X2 [Ischnura elegans]